MVFSGQKPVFRGLGAKKLMGTRVLAKTHFFSSEIDSRFSYFSTFSKSQLRFGARSFGARSLLYSRTCVYARACMRVRVCACVYARATRAYTLVYTHEHVHTLWCACMRL